jgi:hypothetical protein
MVKAGIASRPILHRDKDSMIQSTYYGSGRQGTDCNKDSMTQEEISPPAFPWLIDSILTLYYELMVGGRKGQKCMPILLLSYEIKKAII